MYLQDLADFASMHKESGNDVDYDDNSIDCDDLLDHDDRDSDEDTEDASETDMVKQREEECTEIKEQMYRDKLAMLKKQLTQLKEETHPEYLKRLRKIEQLYQERLFLNEVFQSHEVERVEREYLHEKKAAVREFEEKKIDLRESLIMDLEEKRRAIEAERSTVELTGEKRTSWRCYGEWREWLESSVFAWLGWIGGAILRCPVEPSKQKIFQWPLLLLSLPLLLFCCFWCWQPRSKSGQR